MTEVNIEFLRICKEFIDWFTNIKGGSRPDILAILSKGENIPVSGGHKINISLLPGEYKNLIVLYIFPRYILDRQLPGYIQVVREKGGSDLNETAVILEAYRGQQYVKFIRHLFFSFVKDTYGNEDFSKAGKTTLIPPDFEGCPICGTHEGEFIGSTQSGILLCPRCLCNLINASRVLDVLEPGFITNYGYLKHA